MELEPYRVEQNVPSIDRLPRLPGYDVTTGSVAKRRKKMLGR